MSSAHEYISTVLGSCVAACIRDPVAGCGGMNHFMLPFDPAGSATTRDGAMYGGYAMDHLIDELLHIGAQRQRLEAKIFGGGNVIALSAQVGLTNIHFARAYLEDANIPLVGEDVGGDFGRSLVYCPATGKAMVKRLPKVYSQTIVRRERDYNRQFLPSDRSRSTD